MTRYTASALAAAALVLGACGEEGNDSRRGSAEQQQGPAQPERSTLDCLDLSVLSPERDTKPNNEAGPEIEPLLSDGAQSSTILGGDELSATVIEYPDAGAAARAYDKARAPKSLKRLGARDVTVRGDVLFIDYSKDGSTRKIVGACIDRPGQPPPSP